MIEKGKIVKFDYILTVNGKIVDSSKKSGPFKYTHGKGNIIKGLERQLERLKVGDKRTIVVSAKEAYGPVDPNAFDEVSKSNLPEGIDLKVGLRLEGRDKNGRRFPVTVSEIRKDTIVVNRNHSLAGKELQFEVTILDVQNDSKN